MIRKIIIWFNPGLSLLPYEVYLTDLCISERKEKKRTSIRRSTKNSLHYSVLETSFKILQLKMFYLSVEESMFV